MEERITQIVTGWITANKPAMIPPGGLRADLDLLRAGILDSLDYLTIVEHVGGELGFEVDIAAFEDVQLGTITGIAKQISKQAPEQ